MDDSTGSCNDFALIGSLNEHERQILALFAEHRSNQEIADTLFLSLNTVKWYARQIYGKLEVVNRREAVVRANQLGLLGTSKPVASAIPHNLPAHLTPFVGRQAELAELRRLLLDPGCRLLTITGPGGMGKTRLAVAMAEWLMQEPDAPFTDGVFLVALADLSDSESIASAVANAVGLRFSLSRQEPVQQLVAYLRSKKMLLLLDNFEHLLDDLSLRFVINVLKALPDIKMLVTSRIRLNIRGEQGFPLFGLEIPKSFEALADTSEDADSVELFADAAHRANPAFLLDPATLPSVIDICRLVEGLPLAIELAAAWTLVLDPTHILTEVRNSLDFLVSDAANVPDRHRSLPAVFAASWQLLNEAERAAMQGLSIFRGGFTCDAAGAVADVSPQVLQGLLRKSWLQREVMGRYRMHALLQQYAAEKLAADAVLQSEMSTRHSLHFCKWLVDVQADLLGFNHAARMNAIHADIENVHAACLWAAEHEHFSELDGAIESLGLYYRRESCNMTGDQMLERLARILAGVTDSDGLHALAQILAWRCFFSAMLGDYQTSRNLAEETLSLIHCPSFAGCETRDLEARVYLQLASTIWVYMGDAVAAEKYFRRSLNLFEEVDDKIGMALASLSFGRFQRTRKRYTEAEAAFRLTIQLLESTGSQSGYSDALGALGTLAYLKAQFDEAEHLLTESLSMAVPDDHDAEATALFWLARTYYESGQLGKASLTMDKCLLWRRKQGMPLFTVSAVAHRAMIFRDVGLIEKARGMAAEALSQAQDNDYQLWEGSALAILGSIAFLTGDTHVAFDYLSESIALEFSSQSVLIYTGRLVWFGFVLRAQGRGDEAWQRILLNLDRALDARCYLALLTSLAGLALLLADEGEVERVAELHALLLEHPYTANAYWFSQIITPDITMAIAGLSANQRLAAEERGRAQDIWEVAAQLADQRAMVSDL